MNIRNIFIAACCLTAFAGAANTIDELAQGFQEPPQQARPRVWWHWMNGNISKEGIRKDLEWMKRAGVGGFTVIDAGMATPQVVPQRLTYMSPEWKDAMSYAFRIADSLGLEVTIPSAPGWSLMGGPWVSPTDAMKKLTWRELTLKGNGKKQAIALPEPYRVSGPYQNHRIEPNLLLGEVIPDDLPTFYEDIKVLAVPVAPDSKTLRQMEATLTASDGSALSLDAVVDDDLTTALQVPVDKQKGRAVVNITLAEPTTICALSFADGRRRGEFDAMPADVTSHLFYLDHDGSWQLLCDIPQGGAPLQTLSFEPITARRLRLEIDKPAPDYAAMMMGLPVADPTEMPLYEFNLYTTPRVNHAEEKAGFMATHDLALSHTPNATGVAASAVIDLTDKVDSKGVLHWKAPKGEWKILRMGWSLTGRRNHPASAEGTGLEIDKLDPEAWQRYFGTYLDMMQQIPGSEAIKYMLTDSYESGAQTWTPAMEAEFEARRGYALWPWLPALTGEIIESAAATEQFLSDWRRTIEELYAARYDQLSDLLQQRGLRGRYTESHEHGRLMLADGMDVKRTATVPMSAFWAGAADGKYYDNPMAAADLRESASVANIYGQNIVAAESFTTVGFPNNAWTFSPETLKPYADFAFANGLNQVVVHCSPHQPVDSLRPGMSLSAVGQWFDRQDTWAEVAARPWTDYLSRTSYLLQQGHNVADILLLYPDDSNISALYGHGAPAIPAGYEFDYANPAAARTATGDAVQTADPALLRALLDSAGIRPDVVVKGYEATPTNGDLPLRWRHRSTADGTQIYWLSNPQPQEAQYTVVLREATPNGYIFNPENGAISPLQVADSLSLRFDPHQSLFVVFTSGQRLPENLCSTVKGGERTSEPVNAESLTHFTLQFDGLAAPQPLVLDSLISLSDHPETLVRYFSGTITYTTTFELPSVPTNDLILDLGSVKNIAQVTLNGHPVATLWKAPFRCDITPFVKPGTNTLQVTVTNLWANRLIGDADPATASGTTFITLPYYTPGAPLPQSGLLGPVRLIRN